MQKNSTSIWLYSPNLFVVAAGALWLLSTILSIINSLNGITILYLPEFMLMLVTSIVLLAWGWYAPKFPRFSAKIGYLAIIISITNLVALLVLGSPSHSISGMYVSILQSKNSGVASVVPAYSFYIAYIAAVFGIFGGILLAKSSAGIKRTNFLK